MTYASITSENLTEGLQVLPIYINTITDGLLGSMLLASIWLITLLVSYYSERRSLGRADVLSCTAYAGVITMVAGTLLKMITGMITGLAFSVVVIVGIASVLLLMIQKDNA